MIDHEAKALGFNVKLKQEKSEAETVTGIKRNCQKNTKIGKIKRLGDSPLSNQYNLVLSCWRNVFKTR